MVLRAGGQGEGPYGTRTRTRTRKTRPVAAGRRPSAAAAPPTGSRAQREHPACYFEANARPHARKTPGVSRYESCLAGVFERGCTCRPTA